MTHPPGSATNLKNLEWPGLPGQRFVDILCLTQRRYGLFPLTVFGIPCIPSPRLFFDRRIPLCIRIGFCILGHVPPQVRPIVTVLAAGLRI